MPDKTEEWKWLSDKVWLDLLEPMLFEDSALADRAAKLWHYLLLELESGPEGVTRAAVCLENALRLTFPFTTTYQACMILFQESLGDDFPTKNNSLEVLSEAIVRVKAALRRAERSHRAKQRTGSQPSR
ncbi:MAG TPA: hypothetical protein VN937_10925 [Blastocatellia bacterium]|nr:hypothetical protein [Blastocatellia bacterium]